MTKPQQKFPIPSMTLCREDLKRIGVKGKYTDAEMQRLAFRMSDYILYDWEANLQLAVDDMEEDKADIEAQDVSMRGAKI